MNELELNKELARNEVDRKVAKDEIEAYKNQFAAFALENKDRIFKGTCPVVVKKKKKVILSEIIGKIKIIFGLTKGKESDDGIETYLRYSDDVE